MHAAFRVSIVVIVFLALMSFSYVSMHVKPGDTWYDLGGKQIRDSMFENTKGLNQYFTTTESGRLKISAIMILCGL